LVYFTPNLMPCQYYSVTNACLVALITKRWLEYVFDINKVNSLSVGLVFVFVLPLPG